MHTISRALGFYGKCIAWAAAGTLERANAWFWPVGVPVVALAGWYWEAGTLTMPENLEQFFTFMVVTIAVSWAIFFVVRLLGAAPHFSKLDSETIKTLSAKAAPRLSITFLEEYPFI